MHGVFRFMLCAVIFAVGYMVIQHPTLRPLYAPWGSVAHATAFFAVWWMLLWATRWNPVLISPLAAVLGAAVEIHQMFLPGFFPSWVDWFADLAGIALAVSLWAVFRHWRGARVGVTSV